MSSTEDGVSTDTDEIPVGRPAEGTSRRRHTAARRGDSGSGGQPAARRPVAGRTKILISLLCVLVGFAIMLQVRQTQEDEYASMRQDDLVRLLDEVTQRNEDLAAERDQLLQDRAALRSGTDTQRLAEEYQLSLGVLAGTQPVEGPGLIVTVQNTANLTAQNMVVVLEELRNAGAEAVEVSGIRTNATSAFADRGDDVVLDDQVLDGDIEWRAIGDPQTMSVALNIPGGALAVLRNNDAVVSVEQRDLVQITPVKEVSTPRFAEPVESDE